MSRRFAAPRREVRPSGAGLQVIPPSLVLSGPPGGARVWRRPARRPRDRALHHVIDSESLAECAQAIARSVAEASPTAIHAGLAFLRDARGKSWEEAGDLPPQNATRSFAAPIFRKASAPSRKIVPALAIRPDMNSARLGVRAKSDGP